MKTQLTTALIAAMAFTLSAQVAYDKPAKQAAPALAPSTPYVLYLGDVHGTPFEVLSVGQVPSSGERRLRLPAFRSQDARVFLATAECTYEVSRTDDMGLDAVRPGDMQKKGQWVIGRIDHFVAQAPAGAVLGGSHDDLFSPASPPPVDELPYQTDVEKKGQWVIGRIDPSVAQAPGAGAVIGKNTPKLGTSGQAGDLGLQGQTSSDSVIIACPWGGPESSVDVMSQAVGGSAPVGAGANQAILGGNGGSLDNGLQGHQLRGKAATQQNRPDPRFGGTVGMKRAVEIVDFASPKGANAVLGGGQVTISISSQGLGLLVGR